MSIAQRQETTERSIYSDFVEYQNLDISDAADPVDGTIYAIDTNVLLNLYKYNRKTRDDVIGALTKMSNVLFVPHQTLHEFWSRHEDVQKGGHHGEASHKIETAAADIKRTVDTWLARTGLSDATDSEAATAIEKVVDELGNAASRLRDTIDETKRESQRDGSGIIEALEKILSGRVGPAPSPQTRQNLLEVFRKRVDAGIPPGTRDVEIKKGQTEKAAGDFLIWQQCLDEASRRKAVAGQTFDLTLITHDLKDDWVRGKHTSRPLAQRALLREYAENVGGVFRIATTLNLLDTASAHFGATVSEEARAQVKEVDDAGGTAGWTVDSARKYLGALWSNDNYSGQLAVLLASYGAAMEELPPLSVDEARLVSDRESMAGFSRPYKTILTTANIVGVGGDDITLPMLSREFDEDLNDWAYKLQGDPLTALGEAIAREPDYVRILTEATEQLNTIRQAADG
ncbi:PIN-like domain-containing protein [Arthrobacter sp. YD2]|uniref:PIN-like domain-containing protein n=1 Tax=Arthrobacter sp. YD2 TaxID=3058046 RepID=UPI0025B4C61D|nr:PIN-like domain-containing protein [Arthrobacter sp. YD2]MDN3905746.1 PIN-like domain-containing protein [Arthrobacter sp. YD2]